MFHNLLQILLWLTKASNLTQMLIKNIASMHNHSKHLGMFKLHARDPCPYKYHTADKLGTHGFSMQIAAQFKKDLEPIESTRLIQIRH